MKSGTYKGIQIVGCYVGESMTKKTPYFSVEFMHTASNQYIDWTVYLKDDDNDAIERAKKALQKLRDIGYKGGSIADMANSSLPITQLFGAPIADIELEVEEEQMKDKDGNLLFDSNNQPKMKGVIKWVNCGGSSKFDHQQAVARFSSLRFDSILAGIAQTVNSQQPMATAPAANAQSQSTAAPAASSTSPFANNSYSAPATPATFANDDIPF